MAKKEVTQSATKKEKIDEKLKTVKNIVVANVDGEVIDRHASANLEFFRALDGVNYETGNVNKNTKSLKVESARYHNEKVAIEAKDIPDAKKAKMIKTSLKSHGGFTAEIEEVAVENANRKIARDPTRRIRTDDLDPANGGQVNHPLNDHVDIDKIHSK